MAQHFETEYSDEHGFHAKLQKNTEIIKESVIPELKAQGFGFSARCIDDVAFELTEEQRIHWIDPLHPRNGIRPPDLKSEGNKFINIQGSDTLSVLFEYKDYAQESNFQHTGIPYRNVRTYFAIQHLWENPVYCLFRDKPFQEEGAAGLSAYVSAFKEGDRHVLYGDLLTDMYVVRSRSYLSESTGKVQIRWKCQDGRDGTDPFMKPISSITKMLRDGSIKKVKGDPNELPLWRLIQENSDRMGEPRLIEPPGGLVYFTAKT